MSTATLSNQAQLRYVLQWFQEWSEMQRGDFLSILIEKCGPGGLVNGLVSSLESLVCKDDNNKPPSLFECRAKLFREWSNNWTPPEKEHLLTSIMNTDPKFAEKYQRKITNSDNDDDEEDDDDKDKYKDKEDDKDLRVRVEAERVEEREDKEDAKKEEEFMERNEAE